MIPMTEIRDMITDLESQSQPWVEGSYMDVVRLFRAQIKGLHFAFGEDYNINQGIVINTTSVRSDTDIRNRILEIEESVKEYEDQESVVRLMRSQIKGLKLALGEPYSIAEGK